MKGFPHNLNSKDDYYNIMADFSIKEWKPYWEDLQINRYTWVSEFIDNDDKGIEDAEHYVTTCLFPVQMDTVYDKEGNLLEPKMEERKLQYTRKENPLSNYVRFGFTDKEIAQALSLKSASAIRNFVKAYKESKTPKSVEQQ